MKQTLQKYIMKSDKTMLFSHNGQHMEVLL